MNLGNNAIIDSFATWLDTLGYCNNFVKNSRSNMFYFLEWLEERKYYMGISQLTDKDLIDYCNYLGIRANKVQRGKRLSNATINNNVFAINKLIEFLHQYGMQSAPMPTKYRLKVDEQERINKIEILTQQEIKTLYNTIQDTYEDLPFAERWEKRYELKLILTLYYCCGLRHSEGYNLEINDVNFKEKTVFVRQGKNYKDRIVPMSNGVFNDLQDYIYNFRYLQKTTHNRLFISSKSSLPQKLKYLQSVCDDETLKSKRVHLHCLRHSIATHLLQNGMSIENIAKFLGHSSLESTQIYTHFLD